MKYFLLVLALIAALVAALMFVPAKDGKPLLDPERVKATVEQTSDRITERQDGWIDEAEMDVLYRWKDKNGNWQYGDRPPKGVEAEIVKKKSVKTIPADGSLDSTSGAQQGNQ
ncbi:MAG: DUF4124 domain-containing protein [Alcanivoracaceae bacterium]|nr:DUF4124 domain-containing protein [Alcanivoracaceae bacterium]